MEGSSSSFTGHYVLETFFLQIILANKKKKKKNHTEKNNVTIINVIGQLVVKSNYKLGHKFQKWFEINR